VSGGGNEHGWALHEKAGQSENDDLFSEKGRKMRGQHGVLVTGSPKICGTQEEGPRTRIMVYGSTRRRTVGQQGVGGTVVRVKLKHVLLAIDKDGGSVGGTEDRGGAEDAPDRTGCGRRAYAVLEGGGAAEESANRGVGRGRHTLGSTTGGDMVGHSGVARQGALPGEWPRWWSAPRGWRRHGCFHQDGSYGRSVGFGGGGGCWSNGARKLSRKGNW
jgi:hypothetical protein